ncbi:choice-of-anchor A family protein [Armatimonas rosea]|uniref:Choice-of-anchor A domain-containing protein/RHS repeat-associated protein n=1 Tax=Armatimonas rosea TaxID=685828 RepID=A0A7W9SWF4_ARMRO|nr:choice-of-anchor A family protein [Armatimonas rosea]MBB6054097.1 choice-of-anchor A domain-containing protein/RHS repeat-associated protein [Armatimonas rosea]
MLLTLPTFAQTASLSNLGTANDFNLFVFGNNQVNGHQDINGRVAVGGNLTATAQLDFATSEPEGSSVSLVVGGFFQTNNGELHGSQLVAGNVSASSNYHIHGDLRSNGSISLTNCQIEGSVVYGTTLSRSNTSISGSVSQGTTSLPFDFGAVQTDLTARSVSWFGLASTGTKSTQGSKLTLTGNLPGLNVFSVTTAELDQYNQLTIYAQNGATVLVNVSGASGTSNIKFNLSGGISENRVLVNYRQATNLSFSGARVKGSVLAPLAAVAMNGYEQKGTLVCASLSGNGKLDEATFTGSLPDGSSGGNPTLASLTITPATVTGGTSTTGTVALTAAAPAGGATVTLASNNGAASTPASVTIPAGATSANFTITTSSVTSTTTVTISGTYAGVTKTAGLTINAPPAVTNLSLSPIQVAGGSSSTGTVTIAGLAPAGGVTVSLSSNSTSATVPASVVVPAGAASATFTVSTSSVSAQTTATISASANGGVATAQLIITSPTLLSLTLSPTTVKGGASSTGTVTLSSPAPTGGLTVALTTASPASVPGSVVVPAGATSATFTVATVAVATNTTATVTGSAGGVSKSATLTVTAPTLLSLTLSPTSVNAGEPSTGTVTISDPAPSGGLTVALASSSTFATVPASVSIPAGATSATFAVSTSDVPATTTATITASLNGVNKSASLEIIYVPPTLLSLTVAPATVKGGQSSTGTVTISKAAPAGGTTITLASDNAAATTPSSVTVAAGATTATFTISTVAVPANVTATISASLGGVTKTAPLTITAPKLLTLTLNPTSVDGGQSSTGTVTISDPAPVGGLSIGLTSSNAAATTPASVTIPAGATSADFTVATSVVTAETMATITGTLNGDSASAILTIRYIPPTPKLTLTVSPNQLLGGLTARGTVTLVGNVAPTGGMVIQLASSDSAATVPATVTIPAGETSTSFDIPTTVVLAQRVATLTATGNGGSATATLTILPAPCVESASLVQSISFATNPLIGGREVTGTVTLTGPAVAGGQAILLASNDPTLVPVPAAIFIEGGQTTGTFTINTAPVNLMSWVTVSAGYHASVASATLTLNPGPESGLVGGGGMGSDGPSLTPAALAAGYRLVPFLSGFPPAQLGYGFLSFTSSPDSSIIGLVGNIGQESIKLPNRNYLAYTDKLPYTTSGILGVRSGDGLYQSDFDSGFWRIGTDGNRLSRLVAGGTIRGGAQDVNPNTGGILVSGQFASGVLYPAVEVDVLTGEWHIVAPGQGSGAGAAFSEDGSLLFRKQFSGIEILEYGTSALLSFIAQGGHGIAVGTGSLTNMVYTMDHDLIQVNTATGEKTTIVQGNGALGSQLPSYDGEGNLFLAYNDRAMRLYPPLGAYFGTRLPEQIITRDDKNASYAPLSLSGTNYSGDLANAAAFDLSGVVGGVQAAQVLRAGAITHGFEGTLDAQLGVRSLLGGTITSYATPIPSVEKLASPYNYSQSWALPEVFYPELRLALGGLYTLGLTDKASGICGTWLFGDTPNASWPGGRNQLTLKLSPRGLPITMPGRVVGLTLPRPSRPVRGPWEIWQGQTLIASALAPNGWDVEDDHTIYAGVAVTVPGAANTATYEVRFVGAAAPRGGAGSFRVLASSALAPTLKPLALSSSSVVGGATVTALVELDAPAPAGGATVALSSRGGGISHPDRVDIPAGATSATFVISTQPGAATARIQASYNGYRVARLRIDGGAPLPPGLGLLSVIVAPGMVIGGQDTSLTATLSGPAPDGGVLVNLASSGPEAILPAQLYVPEGATVASTAVQTTQVAAATTLTLTGELNGTSKTAQLTLVGQITAPTVVITSPEDGMTFRVPNRSLNIDIRAAATVGAGATLQKIELFANGNKIASLYGQNPVIHTQNFTPGVYELQARAVDSFGQASLSEKVTIYLNDSFFQTPRPQIRPRGGNYTGPQTITITVPNAGFDPWNPAIYYTLDGSDPAVNGLRYTGPFVILSDTTVKAVARFADWAMSPQASESYVISGGGGGPGADNLTAVITAPVDGGLITQPSQVTGTITSTNGAGWRLWYRLAGETSWKPLASGMAAAGAQTISTLFDPTLVLNGTYQLFLEARTAGGTSASDLTSFIVEGNMKIGNFKLSFTDLVVPIAGIPITVTRSYDTLDKRTGDFGVGWTLQMSNIRLQKSVPIHDFWEERADAISVLGQPAFNFFFRQSKKHYITITFPSGEVYRFAAVYSPQFQGLSPINAARLDWVPVGRTRGTLRPTAEIGQSTTATNVLVAPLGGGVYNNPDWTAMELIGYGDGNGTSGEYEPTEFELTTLDGTVWIIDEKKGLVKVTEPNGNQVSFGPNGITSSNGVNVSLLRDGTGRITAITDPMGKVMRYQIDGRGDLTAFKDRMGNRTSFTYDVFHNLLTVNNPTGSERISNQYNQNNRWSTLSDGNGEALRFEYGIDDPNVADNIETITNVLGHKTVVSRNNRGNVTSRIRYLGTRPITVSIDYTDPAHPDMPTEIVDAMGFAIRNEYGPLGELLRVSDGAGQTISTRTYDANGRLLTETRGDGVRVMAQTYDAKGNVATGTDALNNTWTFTRNANGTLSQMIDPLGYVSRINYDSFGRVHQTISPSGFVQILERNLNGAITAKELTRSIWVSGNGGNAPRGPSLSPQLPWFLGQPVLVPIQSRSEYSRDANNRVEDVTFPDGSTSSVLYDPDGRVQKVKDVIGRFVEYVWDKNGLPKTIKLPNGMEIGATHDPLGRRETATDRLGRRTNYTWDALGRLTDVALFTTDGVKREHYEYNDNGDLVLSRDALNRETTISYTYYTNGKPQIVVVRDPQGRTQTTRYSYWGDVESITDGAGRKVSYEYDAKGRTSAVIANDSSRTRYEYDANDNVTAVVLPSGRRFTYTYSGERQLTSTTDPGNLKTTFHSDELGNVLSYTDALNRTTMFQYDASGYLSGRRLPMGQGETIVNRPDGKPLAHTDFRGRTTTFTYGDTSQSFLTRITPDPFLNEPSIVTDYDIEGKPLTVQRGNITNSFGYDAFGRVRRTTGPTGSLFYEYDLVDRLTRSVTPNGQTTYSYDNSDLLTGTVDTSGALGYNYDSGGRLTSMSRSNGMATVYGYNDRGNVTQVAHSVFGLAPILYEYDADSRRTRVQESTGTTVYGYDDSGRLTSENHSARGMIEYVYDNAHNRRRKITPQGTFVYNYNDNDELLQITAPSGFQTTYDYDLNGSCIRAGLIPLAYDSLGALVQAGQTTFGYDALGTRYTQTTQSGTTSYLADITGMSQVVEEYTGLGGNFLKARYGPGTMTRNGATSWFVTNGSGSTGALTDNSGSITDSFVYDAFGSPTRLTGNTPTSLLYGGQEFDESTGLYFLRARYYDAQAGRFLARDPVMGYPNNPLTLNGYNYAGADPVNNSDFSGLDYTLTEGMTVLGMVNSVRGMLGGLPSFMGDVSSGAYDHPKTQEQALANAEHLMSATLGTLADTIQGVTPLLSGALRLINVATMTYIEERDALDTLFDPYADAEAKMFASLAIASRTASFAVESVLEFAANGVDGAMDMAIKSWDTAMGDGTAEYLLNSPIDMGRQVKKYTYGSGDMKAVHVSRGVGDPYEREGLCEKNDCFVAGTKVLMGNGQGKPIEQIQVGEQVYSFNPSTGKLEAQKVTETFVSIVSELREVHIGDSVYLVTPDHPFLTNKGWVTAEALGIGTQIITRAGPSATTTRVRDNKVISAQDPLNRTVLFGYDIDASGFRVYNIEVQNLHNYVVNRKSEKGLKEQSRGQDDYWNVVHNPGRKAAYGAGWTGAGMSATRRDGLPTTAGIYHIKNASTGEEYIGKAVNVKTRLTAKKHTNARDLMDKGSDQDVSVNVYPVTFAGQAASDPHHSILVAEQTIMDQFKVIPKNHPWKNDIVSLSPSKLNKYRHLMPHIGPLGAY